MKTLDGFRICSRCVMDTSDPEIVFDKDGICSHCNNFDVNLEPQWFPNDLGEKKLEKIISEIKSSAHPKSKYDCIMGISGGVDSSYLAVQLKKYKLRVLAVHVDGGWNSDLAVSNIKSVIDYCGYDLFTHVVDWNEMRDLQLAYLRSGISNQDVPQDHIFFATLYHLSNKFNIRYNLSGGNIATESVLPASWQVSAMDSINLLNIHRKFGKVKLKNYKTISFFDYFFNYPILKKFVTVRPLNFMSYNKVEAVKYLVDEVGYRPYDGKHGESIFTKFFQSYYLPRRFGFDKRKPHLSSLILSGQISRSDALKQLASPPYDENEIIHTINYVCKKLQISPDELEKFMSQDLADYRDFRHWGNYYTFFSKLSRLIPKNYLSRKGSLG